MEETIPIYKIKLPIIGEEAVLSVCGDFHYGTGGITKNDIIFNLNKTTDQYKDRLFRLFTGDLIENQLKTSVGHNYDVDISDPHKQKVDMIDILNQTNKYLYGKQKKINQEETTFEDIRSGAVEGNHEYRTRKTSGQWLSREIHTQSNTLDLGSRAIIELTIYNKKNKNITNTFKIFIAHRATKSDATSPESRLRAFKKKQATLPGIDIFAFGHYHDKFLFPDCYFDIYTGHLRKVIYCINPSPMKMTEYAREAGYNIVQNDYSLEIFLPIDQNREIYSII